MDSLAAIADVDVQGPQTCIQILVRQDKVKNQEGGQRKIYCNCAAELQVRFCPINPLRQGGRPPVVPAGSSKLRKNRKAPRGTGAQFSAFLRSLP